MRASRRVVTAACLLTAGSLTALVLAIAPADAGAQPPAVAHRAGDRHLIYLTSGERIMEATVTSRGSVTAKQQIAPAPGTPAADRPFFVVASPDGRWLAWSQARGNRRPMLYLRNLVTGDTTTIATNKSPAGFAGDTLLVTFNKTFRLVLSPSPHFVYVPHAGIALTGWAHGAIDTTYADNTGSGTLRLTSWSGRQTRLHHYTDFGPPNYRTIDAAWVSADNRQLLVERGNHQDFGGLGRNSLVDEFALTGHHHRTALGQYPGNQVWRVTGAAFRGAGNVPYAAWEAQTRSGVRTVVARFSAGRWIRVRNGAIAVAADPSNDLLVQPGDYAMPHTSGNPTDYPAARPTKQALLRMGRRNYALSGVRGIEFWFAAG